MSTFDVRFWAIRRVEGRRQPYGVRWVVAGRQRSEWFRTKAQADGYRSQLMQAARRGEAFDEETGLPEPMLRKARSRTWYEFACAYVDAKWPSAAAKTRASTADALATVTPALVRSAGPGPDPALLRRALMGWAFNPSRRASEVPRDIASALRWVERSSLPMVDLRLASVVRQALDAVTVRMDGRPAAATSVNRKRAVLYNALRFAVEQGDLSANPLDTLAWSRPKTVQTVDRRVVVNPRQAWELLTAVTYVGRANRGPRLRALFACMYFAALRPAEALAVTVQGCELPDEGWGAITLTGSRPAANKAWTDSGDVHDVRGLKHRANKETRTVPIPPVLVDILRKHVDEYGTASDGRLFFTPSGGVVSASSYWRVWSEARPLALTPEQVASPLATRPYDLRHAAVSTWLNAGVPATEVAERAGHSVEVLLQVYAKCVDGERSSMNHRIESALSGM